MCGIIGYTGRENAAPYLVSGLEALEYRGYDSVGIAEECGSVGDGIFAAVREMTGSYAFVVMHRSRQGELYAIRKKSPLIAAETKDGLVFASDVTAVMSECDEFYRIPEDTLAVAGEGGLKFYDESGEEVYSKPEKILWSRDAAEKNGFPHYMLKEINEEPEVIEKTAARFIKDGIPDFSEAFPEDTAGIHIVACGSAMHAGIVGKYVIEKLARIPVSVETASEFRYRIPAVAKTPCSYSFPSREKQRTLSRR